MSVQRPTTTTVEGFDWAIWFQEREIRGYHNLYDAAVLRHDSPSATAMGQCIRDAESWLNSLRYQRDQLMKREAHS